MANDVRTIHSTRFDEPAIVLRVTPRSDALPHKYGAISFHCRSFKTTRTLLQASQKRKLESHSNQHVNS